MPLTTFGEASEPSCATLVGLRVVRPVTMKNTATSWIASWIDLVVGVAAQNVVSPALP